MNVSTNELWHLLKRDLWLNESERKDNAYSCKFVVKHILSNNTNYLNCKCIYSSFKQNNKPKYKSPIILTCSSGKLHVIVAVSGGAGRFFGDHKDASSVRVCRGDSPVCK